MAFLTRDGKFDLAVVAAPGISIWPSIGVRVLSSFCAEMKLSVGILGGEGLRVRGVIPLPGTGGLVLVEDSQRRIHRIQARAIVKISPVSSLPDPFPGWRSQGLLPLSSANWLRTDRLVQWMPATVILGTGNGALRFGSRLLESGVTEVLCLETHAQWGAKRFAGWEVERRQFEINGGKLLEGRVVSLMPKSALLWELRVQDQLGIRVLEVARVVAAGPFRDLPGVREYPPASFLFEIDQTAPTEPSEDMDGWAMEEERGRWLAAKISKALIHDLGSNRERVDHALRRARSRLKKYSRHREEPFTPSYQGKWISPGDSEKMRTYSGVPKQMHRIRPVASVECFEEISCNICQVACPEFAIGPGRILDETKCTGCGACLLACPSKTINLIQEREEQSLSVLFFPVDVSAGWAVGDFGTLLNRRGETLGSGRVVGATRAANGHIEVLRVELPTHLVWEARGIRRLKKPSPGETLISPFYSIVPVEERLEIAVNGERRLVRHSISVSMALFEIGQGRPEDILLCPDGSCGLCKILVDGVRKLACQTEVHRGMVIRVGGGEESSAKGGGVSDLLCPCMGISREEIIRRLKHGRLRSAEALLSVTHIGEGKCHGQLCIDAFKRMLIDQGLDASQWIDWRFPWSDWILSHN